MEVVTGVTTTGSDGEWDDWVAMYPHGHLLQTSRWARLKWITNCSPNWINN